jgi:hypothetical protein
MVSVGVLTSVLLLRKKVARQYKTGNTMKKQGCRQQSFSQNTNEVQNIAGL